MSKVEKTIKAILQASEQVNNEQYSKGDYVTAEEMTRRVKQRAKEILDTDHSETPTQFMPCADTVSMPTQ